MANANNANNAGYVYFILREKANRVKIGKSRDVNRRLKELREGGFDHLKVLLITAFTPDAFALETSFHKRFAACRVEGEWFEYNNAIKQFIEEERLRSYFVRFTDHYCQNVDDSGLVPEAFKAVAAGVDLYRCKHNAFVDGEKLPTYIHELPQMELQWFNKSKPILPKIGDWIPEPVGTLAGKDGYRECTA